MVALGPTQLYRLHSGLEQVKQAQHLGIQLAYNMHKSEAFRMLQALATGSQLQPLPISYRLIPLLCNTFACLLLADSL